MESLELRIFKEVAYTGSITGAAANLNYVQSNVTAHIKRLEEELGTTLFVRHGKGVTLTEDGGKLLYYADAVLELLERAVSEFRKDSPKLKIGTTQTLAATRLPRWIADYQKQHPGVACSCVTDRQDRLISLLEKGEADCVFVESQYLKPHLKSIFSFKEMLSILAPAGSTLEDICRYPLIVNAIETCPYRKMLQNWVLSQIHYIPALIELDTVEAISHAVALRTGISLLPTAVTAGNRKLSTFQVPGIDKLTIHMVTACNSQKNEVYQFREVIIPSQMMNDGIKTGIYEVL